MRRRRGRGPGRWCRTGRAPAVSGCAQAAGADRRWDHPLAETMTMRHRRVARQPLARRASAAVALLTLAGALAAAVIAVLPVLVVLPVAAAGVVATLPGARSPRRLSPSSGGGWGRPAGVCC